MTETKGARHTPGEWRQAHRKRHDGNYVTEVFDASDETIATVAWYPVRLADGTLTTSREANARLIAAAPTMLDALDCAEAVMSIVEPRSDKAEYLACLAKVRAAIAKATQP